MLELELTVQSESTFRTTGTAPCAMQSAKYHPALLYASRPSEELRDLSFVKVCVLFFFHIYLKIAASILFFPR